MEGTFGTPLPLIVGVIAGLLVGLAWSLHHELVDRRQGQAAMVGGRIPAPGSRLTGAWLTNGSDQPVYGVVAWIVATGGAEPRTGEEWVARIRRDAGPPGEAPISHLRTTPALLPLLPPGSTELDLPSWASSMAGGLPGVELAFTDTSGRHWIRRAGGRLARIDAPAWRHYGFTSPGAV